MTSVLLFLLLGPVNLTNVIQMFLQGDKHGTSLPQRPEVSRTNIFNTETMKQKHGPLSEQGQKKPEPGGRTDALRTPL